MRRLISVSLLLLFLVTSCFGGNKSQNLNRNVQNNSDISNSVEKNSSTEVVSQALHHKEANVGVLIPITGANQDVGNELLKAVEMANFDIKSDRVVLKIYDTKSTKEGMIDTMREVINDGIKIVIGPVFNSHTKAILDMAKRNDVIVFTLSNDDSLAYNHGLYVLGISPKQEIERLVSFAVDNENKFNFSAFLPNDSFGASISAIYKDTIQRKDGRVISIEFYGDNDKRLEEKTRAMVASFKIPARLKESYESMKFQLGKDLNDIQKKVTITESDRVYADCVFIPDYGNIEKLHQMITLYQDEARVARKNKKINIETFSSIVVGDSDRFDYFNLEGVIFASLSLDSYKLFKRDYARLYGINPTRISSISYDIIAIIDELLKLQKNGNFNRTEFISNLERKNGLAGINGLARFLPNGIVERKFDIYKISGGKTQVLDNDSRDFFEY